MSSPVNEDFGGAHYSCASPGPVHESSTTGEKNLDLMFIWIYHGAIPPWICDSSIWWSHLTSIWIHASRAIMKKMQKCHELFFFLTTRMRRRVRDSAALVGEGVGSREATTSGAGVRPVQRGAARPASRGSVASEGWCGCLRGAARLSRQVSRRVRTWKMTGKKEALFLCN